MKASVVFKHGEHPCAVLRSRDDEFFVVTSEHYVDMAHSDAISGDLTLADVKWLLNLTRGTLINIRVLGRYVTINSAIEASSTELLPAFVSPVTDWSDPG